MDIRESKGAIRVYATKSDMVGLVRLTFYSEMLLFLAVNRIL